MLVLFDFSGVYGQQDFYEGRTSVKKECQDIPGTNCYCDEEARTRLISEIRDLPFRGIHFLDSGNYHYLSRLWLEKLCEPFVLLMLDHHTDMQPPAFGGLLSCGGWLEDALASLSNLKGVWLAGPPDADLSRISEKHRERVKTLSQEEMGREGALESFVSQIPLGLPVYVSIDKDVLSPEEVTCNWSQGSLGLKELKQGLRVLYKRVGAAVIGVDICGEPRSDAPRGEINRSSHVNAELLSFLEDMERNGNSQLPIT